MDDILLRADERKKVWAELNSADPRLAHLISDIKKVFGQPQYIDVTIDGDLKILRSTNDAHKKV